MSLTCVPVTLLHSTYQCHTPRTITHFLPVTFLVRNISSQSSIHTGLTAVWALLSVNPQPWRFTNNGLGLPYAYSLSVCLFLWVCVVCVCFLLYLSFYLCCARCIFCVLFYIHNHLFVFFLLFLQNSIDTYVTVPIDEHIASLICLSFSSFCTSICLIHAYVYVNWYKHLLPLPHLYTPIAISLCIYVPIIVKWPLIIWILQIKCVLVYLLIETSADVYTLVTPCSRVSISILIRVYASYEYTYHVPRKNVHFCMHPPFSICAFFNINFTRICSIHLNTCKCVHAYTKPVQINHEIYRETIE